MLRSCCFATSLRAENGGVFHGLDPFFPKLKMTHAFSDKATVPGQYLR